MSPTIEMKTAKKSRLPMLDLFSGIGGISLALQHRFYPIAYCEIDEYAAAVLHNRIADGKLYPAPVIPDVTQITGKSLPKHSKVKMISAGFPCQDLSTAGSKHGIHGARSGLFSQIMRLVDELPSVQIICLENVPNIVQLGIETVLAELAVRGFDMRWTVISAAHLGAWHVRRRWFLVAHRGKSLKIPAAVNNHMQTPQKWSQEPPVRVALRPDAGKDPNWDKFWRRRQMALGNAVVPCVARFAFDNLLLSRSSWHTSSVNRVGRLYDGVCINGVVSRTDPLHFDQRLVTWKTPTILLDDGTIIPHMSTLRTGFVYGAPRITHKTAVDWVHQIKCSKEARAYVKSKLRDITDCRSYYFKIIVAPTFCEFLMGYAPNWTAVAPESVQK